MSFCKVTLGDLIQPALSVRAGSNEYPVLSMTMHEGLIDQSKKFKKRVASEDTSTYKIVTSGQLVVGFPIDEGVLSFQNLYNQAIVSPAYDVWEIKSDILINRSYLHKYLRSPHALNFYRSKLRSTTARRRSLPKDVFLSLQVPLPGIDEQKRIAAILDQADSLRRLRQKALDRLNTLGQAIFYEMFGDWSGRKSNWNCVELGEKIDFLTSGSRGWAKYYANEGAKFIRIQNVLRDKFDSSDVILINPPKTAEAKRTRVRPGDVLFSITADLGRTAVVPSDIGEAYINQHLALIRTTHFNPRFLSAALSSPSTHINILRKNRAAVKAGLNFDDVRSLEIIDPPREMQDEFEKRIQQIEQTYCTAINGFNKINFLFSSLQHRAFRGEL